MSVSEKVYILLSLFTDIKPSVIGKHKTVAVINYGISVSGTNSVLQRNFTVCQIKRLRRALKLIGIFAEVPNACREIFESNAQIFTVKPFSLGIFK